MLCQCFQKLGSLDGFLVFQGMPCHTPKCLLCIFLICDTSNLGLNCIAFLHLSWRLMYWSQIQVYYRICAKGLCRCIWLNCSMAEWLKYNCPYLWHNLYQLKSIILCKTDWNTWSSNHHCINKYNLCTKCHVLLNFHVLSMCPPFPPPPSNVWVHLPLIHS